MDIAMDEAIEILTKGSKKGIFAYDERDLAAIKLGAEGLKRLRDSRVAVWNAINRTLPGEEKR